MRAFVAMELPEAFEDGVAGMARRLAREMSGRFVPRQNYHVTLAFLGDVDEAGIRSAMGALDEACAGASPVALRPEGLGKFGRPSDATLWMGLAATPELMGLAQDVRAALRSRGLTFDDKPFMPHVTLARRARIPRGELPHLGFPVPAEAGLVTLFKSTLAPEGATYKPLYDVELRG